jgi:hypothetical protein
VIRDFVKSGPKPRIVLKTEVEDLRRFWRPQDLMKTVEKFSKKFWTFKIFDEKTSKNRVFFGTPKNHVFPKAVPLFDPKVGVPGSIWGGGRANLRSILRRGVLDFDRFFTFLDNFWRSSKSWMEDLKTPEP